MGGIKTEIKNKKRRKRELLADHMNRIDVKIALLSGSAFGDFPDYLEIYLLERGIRPTFFIGDFNRYYEDAVYSEALLEFAPDVVYIHTTRHNIMNWPEMNDTDDEVFEKLDMEYARFDRVWNALSSRLSTVIIQNNFEAPCERAYGGLERSDFRGHVWFVSALNEKINAYAREHESFIVQDIAWLSAREGMTAWHDPRHMYMFKFAVSVKCMPYLAKNLASVIAAVYGKRKKCIVLDLDNTLWGGVVGDIGPSKLKIGMDSAEGEAFLAFQNYLRRLSETGVILAVASKNEEEAAKSGFKADGMLLTEEDFVCFYANWDPKHENIQKIADELNIGLDSIVFIDDNPVERELVAKLLPDVSVIDANVPQDFIRAVDTSGFFELAAVSKEDTMRARMYKDNIKRRNAMPQFDNYDDFLRSLSMKCGICPVNNSNLERVASLINKTNQFNITAARMTEAEVTDISRSREWLTLCGRLTDKFGENGLVTVFMGKIESTALTVSVWVMSCRVFSRMLEYALFDEIIKKCREKGIERIIGIYKPTQKNQPVKELYEKLGFKRMAPDKEDDEIQWEYVIPGNYVNKTDVIQMEEQSECD